MKRSLIIAIAAAVLPLAALGETDMEEVKDYVVEVINNSSNDVFHILASPASSDRLFNTDLLGKRTIRRGESALVNFRAESMHGECVLNIRAYGPFSWIHWDDTLNVCEVTEWTLYDPSHVVTVELQR